MQTVHRTLAPMTSSVTRSRRSLVRGRGLIRRTNQLCRRRAQPLRNHDRHHSSRWQQCRGSAPHVVSVSLRPLRQDHCPQNGQDAAEAVGQVLLRIDWQKCETATHASHRRNFTNCPSSQTARALAEQKAQRRTRLSEACSLQREFSRSGGIPLTQNREVDPRSMTTAHH